MKASIKNLVLKKDKRGILSEIIRAEDVDNKAFGQLMLTTVLPGFTKGEHFHKRKTEWYCVIKGRGLLEIINNKTKEKEEIIMEEENMQLAKILPNHFHSIKNIGKDEMYLLVYINEVFDPLDPDTFTKMGSIIPF